MKSFERSRWRTFYVFRFDFFPFRSVLPLHVRKTVSDDTVCLLYFFLRCASMYFVFIYFIFIFDKWFSCSMNRNKSKIPLHFVNGNERECERAQERALSLRLCYFVTERDLLAPMRAPKILKWTFFGPSSATWCCLGIVFYLLFYSVSFRFVPFGAVFLFPFSRSPCKRSRVIIFRRWHVAISKVVENKNENTFWNK